MIDFSTRQKQTIATALTILSALVILGTLAGIAWLIAIFFNRFSLVILPVVVAGVSALVVNPYYDALVKRLKHPALALVALFVSVLIPLVAFGWFFGDLLVGQIRDILVKAPLWIDGIVQNVENQWPEFKVFLDDHEVLDRIRAAVEENATQLISKLGLVSGKALGLLKLIFSFVGVVLAWAVLPVYFGFFLMMDPVGTDDIERLFPFLKHKTRLDVVFLLQEFVKIVVTFFRGQLLIALLQGLLFALGFSLVNLKYGFILGLVLGFLNIIPYLGSIVGLGVAIPLGFFQTDGGIMRVVAVLVVFTVVQMIEGYLLTPRIMGDRTGLHPIVIIFAIFFWGSALGGIGGMILAIPLTAFGVVLWRLARDKYIQEIV